MTKQKTQEFKSYTTPKRVWKIFVGVLVRPKETMENTIFQWKEAWVYLLSFLVLSIANDQVQSWVFMGQASWKETLYSTTFTFFYIWLFLSLVLQVISLIFGGRENIFTMMGSMAYSLIPMILLTLIELIFSLLVWQNVIPYGAFAEMVPRVLSWVGTAWAWPGILCLFMLQNIYKFGYQKAAGVLLITWIVVAISWILPH